MNAMPTAVAFCASLIAQDPQQPEHLLRLAPISDTQWLRVQQAMSYEHPDSGRDAIQRIRFDMIWEINGSPAQGGASHVRERIDRLRVAETGAASGRRTASYTYDSATDDAPPGPLRSYTGLLDGEATHLREAGGSIDERVLPAAWRRHDALLESPHLSRTLLLRPLELQVPEHPVAVGATWRGAQHGQRFGRATTRLESEFTLLSAANGRATIREHFALVPVRAAGEEAVPEGTGTRSVRHYTLDLAQARVVAVTAITTIATSLRNRPIHLRVHRESKALQRPVREALPPLAPPPLSASWRDAVTGFGPDGWRR